MGRTCENCKYSCVDSAAAAMFCMGQKNMPVVRPFDTCDDWKSMRIANADKLRQMSDEGWAKWIPCSEELPEELKPVNITWVNRMPESYYKDIKDKPFTATGVYFCEQWYWWSTLCTDMLSEYGRNHCDRVDEHIEVIAWMELPEPYKEGGRKNEHTD